MQWYPHEAIRVAIWVNRSMIDEVERALVDKFYRAVQARNASVTASGRSMVDRWPDSCTMLSFDPAIPAASVQATETGVRASSFVDHKSSSGDCYLPKGSSNASLHPRLDPQRDRDRSSCLYRHCLGPSQALLRTLSRYQIEHVANACQLQRTSIDGVGRLFNAPSLAASSRPFRRYGLGPLL